VEIGERAEVKKKLFRFISQELLLFANKIPLDEFVELKMSNMLFCAIIFAVLGLKSDPRE
jgi:hypothetical protein